MMKLGKKLRLMLGPGLVHVCRLCCLCGISIEPNDANMCANCLASQVDIAEDIPKESMLVQCKTCLRYQRGSGWLECDWESKELMAICLKNIHGTNKVKIIDADFIWTEPHSKRVKLKLTIRREALRGVMVQKSFIVTFVVHNLKCTNCNKEFHNETWKATVQIRQKVDHKRTFLHLEQTILKSSAHANATGMVSLRDGMDFFFSQKSHAEKFCSFIGSCVPQRVKTSSKLVSADNHNNTANIKLTYYVEIVPLCKHDLVILPKQLAQHCGSMSRLVMVSRVTAQVHIVDPYTCRRSEITAEKFWREPCSPLLTSSNLVTFIILDIEPLDHQWDGKVSGLEKKRTRDILSEAEIVRESDFGVNDTSFRVLTHLGGLLKPGDSVQGYDLQATNFSGPVLNGYDKDLPDIVLVRRLHRREKDYKLKSLNIENAQKITKAEQQKLDQDYQEFLNQYEDEDSDGLQTPFEAENDNTHQIDSSLEQLALVADATEE